MRTSSEATNGKADPSHALSRRSALIGLGTLGAVGSGVPVASADQGAGNGPQPETDETTANGNGADSLDNEIVLAWVEKALETARQGLIIPTSGRVYAFLGTVMYDAVNGIHRQRGAAFEAGEQYAVEADVEPGACRVAALAGGANEILTRLAAAELDAETAAELSSAYDDLLDKQLATYTDGDQAAGETWGRNVATTMIETERADAEPDCNSQFDIAPDKERDLEAGMAQLTDAWGSACLADLEPWGLDEPDAVVAPEPPAVDSLEFAVEYNRTRVVADLGRSVEAIQSTEITFDIDEDRYDEAEAKRLANGTYVDGAVDDEELGYSDDLTYDESENTLTLDIHPPDGFRNEGSFWAALGGTPQPEGRWLQVAKANVENEGLGFYETVRLYARLGIGVQDAGIANWNNKRRYAEKLGWRPHAAIGTDEQNPVANLDLPDVSELKNPDLETQDDWKAISGWSPAPEYASGLTTISTTSQRLLEAEFGAVGEFEVTVETAAGEQLTETYDGFDDARDQAAKSRVWSGRHYAPAMLAAIEMADEIVEEVQGAIA